MKLVSFIIIMVRLAKEEFNAVMLDASWPQSGSGTRGLMMKAVMARAKNMENWIICLKNSLLMKVSHLTLRRSTTTYSIRSRCSNFGPNTMRLRAEMVLRSPVSESIVSRYLQSA